MFLLAGVRMIGKKHERRLGACRKLHAHGWTAPFISNLVGGLIMSCIDERVKAVHSGLGDDHADFHPCFGEVPGARGKDTHVLRRRLLVIRLPYPISFVLLVVKSLACQRASRVSDMPCLPETRNQTGIATRVHILEVPGLMIGGVVRYELKEGS